MWDLYLKYVIVDLIAYVIFVIVALATSQDWKKDTHGDDWFWLFFGIPVITLIPIVNLVVWGLMIGSLFEESKKNKTKAKKEQDKCFYELNDFAYNFTSKLYRNDYNCPNISEYYNQCRGKIKRITDTKYETIHNMHNKKAENLFLRTMAIIMECYNNNDIKLCQLEIEKSLETLSETLQVELDAYEKDYQIAQNSAKNIYVSKFDELNQEIKNAKELNQL